MVAKLAKIGVVPGQDFDLAKLEPAVQKGLSARPERCLREDHGSL